MRLLVETFSCRRIGGKERIVRRIKVERIAGPWSVDVANNTPSSIVHEYELPPWDLRTSRGPTQLPRLDGMLAYAAGESGHFEELNGMFTFVESVFGFRLLRESVFVSAELL